MTIYNIKQQYKPIYKCKLRAIRVIANLNKYIKSQLTYLFPQ